MMTPPEAAPMREDVTPEQHGFDAFHAGAARLAPYPPSPNAVMWLNGWDIAQSASRLAHTARPDAGDEVERVVNAAVEPWADFHGDLPDYDHPMRCVFESGVQYTVELLAKWLKVDDWTPCDGTEEFDGDLGGTLMNIVLAAMPKDEHGDPIYPKDLPAAMREGVDRGMVEETFITIDTRTGRKAGDHGTAEQAIEWALEHNPDGSFEAGNFLQQWRQGSADEWPEFYSWLAEQDAAALSRKGG